MAMLEDRLLIWRLKRGHEPAMVRVYAKYRKLLLKLACGLVRDTAAAEDLVQDVFVGLAESVDRLRIGRSLKGYLIQSVLNRARNLHRTNAVRRGGGGVTEEIPAPDEIRPDRWVLHHDQLRRLHEALEELPPEQRASAPADPQLDGLQIGQIGQPFKTEASDIWHVPCQIGLKGHAPVYWAEVRVRYDSTLGQFVVFGGP